MSERFPDEVLEQAIRTRNEAFDEAWRDTPDMMDEVRRRACAAMRAVLEGHLAETEYTRKQTPGSGVSDEVFRDTLMELEAQREKVQVLKAIIGGGALGSPR
jgi:hypothetical protein